MRATSEALLRCVLATRMGGCIRRVPGNERSIMHVDGGFHANADVPRCPRTKISYVPSKTPACLVLHTVRQRPFAMVVE